MNDWKAQLRVPRAPFIPPVVWVAATPTGEGFAAVSRAEEEMRWRELVASDEPIITQVDDGTTAPVSRGWRPSSSCSQPSLVAAMLTALDVQGGQRVLEIGTGTGWNAALLSSRVGARGQVVSVEVDPAVADDARRALATTGYPVLVVTGDGTKGYPAEAPYDRAISTASVSEVPRAWIDQTRPGGLIVTPWGSDYGDDALTRLTVQHDGSASGQCGINLAFMRVRHQRRDYLEPTAEQLSTAHTSQTTLTGPQLFEITDFSRAAFTIGLRVPCCYLTIEDLDRDHRRVELHDARSRSWARLTLVRGHHPWTVQQLGPRRLWNEVETAYDWWRRTGTPTPDRYGLTITPDGTHEVWIDTPDHKHRWSVNI